MEEDKTFNCHHTFMYFLLDFSVDEEIEKFKAG